MIDVRVAEENDIPRILKLYTELNISAVKPESDKKPSLEDYSKTLDEINSIPGYKLLVAEDENNVIVGTMVLLILPNLTHFMPSRALVENLIVDPKQKGKNTGSKLIDYAIRQAKDAGCDEIILNSSNNERTETREFYRSLGFESSYQIYSIFL